MILVEICCFFWNLHLIRTCVVDTWCWKGSPNQVLLVAVGRNQTICNKRYQISKVYLDISGPTSDSWDLRLFGQTCFLHNASRPIRVLFCFQWREVAANTCPREPKEKLLNLFILAEAALSFAWTWYDSACWKVEPAEHLQPGKRYIMYYNVHNIQMYTVYRKNMDQRTVQAIAVAILAVGMPVLSSRSHTKTRLHGWEA